MEGDFKHLIVDALSIMRTAVLTDPSPEAKKSARFVAAAYTKVIKALEALPAVRSYDDVKDIPGIGKEIKANIKEILETKALKAAARVLEEKPIALLDALQTIHDVGPAKATALVAAGITSIADLREKVAANPKLLTKSQTVGLKYFEDIQMRIPRAEMVEHERILTAALDPSFKATIVGSYRRGASDSGDIDLLLMLSAETPKADQVAKFHAAAAKLRADGYLVETLSEGDAKLMGISKVKADAPGRRLDMFLTPQEEFPFALLYATGSAQFNVAMRTYALTKGYSLNQKGLTPTKAGVPVPPPMTTEEEIFTFLGLHYIPPGGRINKRDIAPKGGAHKTQKAGAWRGYRLKTVKRSHTPEKKFDAVFVHDSGREKVQPFGQKGYSDYTKHKDPTRKQRYLKRHAGMGEDWSDPTTAGALSKWILWNKPTFKASLRDYRRRFKV